MQSHPDLDNFDFMTVVRMHPDSILIVDDKNRVIFANTAGLRLLCRLPSSQDMLPACLDIADSTDQIISMIDIAHKELILDVQCQEVQWNGSSVRLYCLSDITGDTHERRSLEKLVYTDHLTNLYNRRGFEQLAINMIASAKRHEQYVSLFYIDVNKLKQINDSHGHGVGDTAIMETADLLRNAFRDSDVIARIGGDEFAVLVTEDDSSTNTAILKRLQTRINRKNTLPNRAYRLSLSIGIVQFEHRELVHFSDLLEMADQQMYAAKHNRRHEYLQDFINSDDNSILTLPPHVVHGKKSANALSGKFL